MLKLKTWNKKQEIKPYRWVTRLKLREIILLILSSSTANDHSAFSMNVQPY